MPPEPLPWERKEFFKERKHERSKTSSSSSFGGSTPRWRDFSSHYGSSSSREFVEPRWPPPRSNDFRRPPVDEMYLASLINKGREVFTKGTTDPTLADLVVINPNSWTMVPIHDCISSLVYCMRIENISVMCNSKWILKDQKILNLDEDEVMRAARELPTKLLSRAGISIPPRMKFL